MLRLAGTLGRAQHKGLNYHPKAENRADTVVVAYVASWTSVENHQSMVRYTLEGLRYCWLKYLRNPWFVQDCHFGIMTKRIIIGNVPRFSCVDLDWSWLHPPSHGVVAHGGTSPSISPVTSVNAPRWSIRKASLAPLDATSSGAARAWARAPDAPGWTKKWWYAVNSGEELLLKNFLGKRQKKPCRPWGLQDDDEHTIARDW